MAAAASGLGLIRVYTSFLYFSPGTCQSMFGIGTTDDGPIQATAPHLCTHKPSSTPFVLPPH